MIGYGGIWARTVPAAQGGTLTKKIDDHDSEGVSGVVIATKLSRGRTHRTAARLTLAESVQECTSTVQDKNIMDTSYTVSS